MVKLAKLLLSTKNIPEASGTKFKVTGSGICENPDGDKQKYLDLESPEKRPTEFRFFLNWTNEKHLRELGVDDTDYLVSVTLFVDKEVEYMKKKTSGIRVQEIEYQEDL